MILFHYFSRYAHADPHGVHYPYEGRYDHFGHGYLGVQFFFIISGFVIAYTLRSTGTLGAFWKNRFIRLFPSMVVCSLITFFICLLYDNSNFFPAAHKVPNLLWNFTFISPKLLNAFGWQAEYVNGSYWSLWTEIQFYFLISLFYYMNPKRFLVRFSIFSLLIYTLYVFVLHIRGRGMFHVDLPEDFLTQYDKWYGSIFDITSTITWFLSGVLCFHLFSKENVRISLVLLLVVFVIQVSTYGDFQTRIAYLLMMILFLVFVFQPSLLKFLQSRIFTLAGMASYSLYLLHENIGLILINRWAGLTPGIPVLTTLLVIIIIIIISVIFYLTFEKWSSRFLKKLFR